ncbi:Ankyrin repeat [Trinorchestia longiramus]|nr:Ankyrin repeat [Trinorchestia longiramus]
MGDVAVTAGSCITPTARHNLLHLAAIHDNAILVRKLLAAGHKVDTCDSHGNTAIHVAAAYGATAALKTLLQEATKTPSTPEDVFCPTGVRCSSTKGVEKRDGSGCQLTSECRDHHAHVNVTNVAGWTPLMLAARYGRSLAINLLLQSGASVSMLNCMETNVLSLGAASGDVASVRSLLRAGASPTAGQVSAVLVAALSGHEAVLRLLLDRGASPNTPVLYTGVTPLMAAALCPSLACVKLLLSRGADPNNLSAAGTPAVHFATLSEDAHQVFVLLQERTTAVSHALLSET